MYWHRAVTGDDYRTAERLAPLHQPMTLHGEVVCGSAAHLCLPPPWPCPQARWCDLVLHTDTPAE